MGTGARRAAEALGRGESEVGWAQRGRKVLRCAGSKGRRRREWLTAAGRAFRETHRPPPLRSCTSQTRVALTWALSKMAQMPQHALSTPQGARPRVTRRPEEAQEEKRRLTSDTTVEEYVALVAEMANVSIEASSGFGIPPFKPPLGRAPLLSPDSVSNGKWLHPKDLISVVLFRSLRGAPLVL